MQRPSKRDTRKDKKNKRKSKRTNPSYLQPPWGYPANNGLYYMQPPQRPLPPPPYFYLPQSNLMSSSNGILPAIQDRHSQLPIFPPIAPQPSHPYYYVSNNGGVSELPSRNGNFPPPDDKQNGASPDLPFEDIALWERDGNRQSQHLGLSSADDLKTSRMHQSQPPYYISSGVHSEFSSQKSLIPTNDGVTDETSISSSDNGVVPTKNRLQDEQQGSIYDTVKREGMEKRSNTSGDRDGKKLPFLKRISNGIVFGLEAFFYKLGIFIASYPKSTIAAAIVVSGLLGIGLINYNQSRDLEDLLIPPTSRIHTDKTWVKENIPYETRIVQFIVENDNVLTRDTLLAEMIHGYVRDLSYKVKHLCFLIHIRMEGEMYQLYNTSLHLKVGDLRIDDVCQTILGNCLITSILDLWEYDLGVIESLTDEEIVEEINTVEFNPIYYMVFNSSLALGGEIYEDGRIVRAGATRMTWSFLMNSSNEEPVKAFENKLIEMGKESQPGIDIYCLTIDAVRSEYFDYVYGDIALIAFSAPAVFLYMIFSMGKFNVVEHGVFLVFAAVFGVLLSASACYGLCLAVGLTFGLTHQGLIFLLLGIGVDDAFVVIETWKRIDKQHHDKPVKERLALTMQHAGVSVTVTSITDFAAFAAGVSSVMPVLSSFCAYGAVGILFLFIMQSTFFPACLYLNQKRVESDRDGLVPCYKHKDYKPNKYSDVDIILPFFKKVWDPLLLSVPGKVIVILISLGLAGVMSWSLSNIKKGMDLEAALPTSSFIRQYIEINNQYFPGEGTPFAVYCDTKDYYLYHKALLQMEEQYRNSPAVISNTVTSWIVPFQIWIQYLKRFTNDPVELDEDGFPVGQDVFNQYLYNFVHTSGFGDGYKSYIEVRNNTGAVDWTVYRMQFILDDDPKVNEQRLKDVRSIADNANTDGTCFAYGELFSLTETIEYVDRELIRNFLLASAAVFIVVLVIVADLRSSLFVVFCVAFTTVCLGGTLQFAGFTVDGNMVVMFTFCIGLSVDFSAHVAYMFMTVKGTRNERAKKALENIGPAIFHGAMSTLLVEVVLVFAQSYTLYLFFCTLSAIMVYGLFAGLCLLPVVLSLIGSDPYPDADSVKSRKFRQRWYKSDLVSSDEIYKIPRPQLKASANNSENSSAEESITYISLKGPR